MSRNTKIVLAIVAGLLVLCVCSVVGIGALGGLLFNRVATTSPARVEAVAVQIAGIELPAGYESDWAVDALGIRAAGFRAGNNHVIVARVPAGITIDMDVIEGQVRAAVRDREGYTWFDHEMRVVSRETVRVAGQDIEIVVAEGDSSSGPYRQMSGMFDGRSGRTFFSIGGPIASWDQDTVNEIIGSLK